MNEIVRWWTLVTGRIFFGTAKEAAEENQAAMDAMKG